MVTSFLLSELNPESTLSIKEIENFKAISHWAYPAILSLCDVTNFKGTIEAIYESLKGKLDIQEVREKVLRLENLNLLKKDSFERYTPTYKKTSVPNDVRNDGVRLYHKSVLEFSKSALDEVELDEREFQSFAISMSKLKTPRGKQMIRQFLTKLERETQDDQTDSVYQFNIQFFRLTNDSSSSQKKEVMDVVSC